MPLSNKRFYGAIDSIATENEKVILDLLEENDTAKVLDCGCASGELTEKVGRKIGASEIYGIELDEAMGRLAVAKGINVYTADLNKELPFEDEFFDVVVSNQVIEHLYNPDLFINEIFRVLKSGGYAIISTPNLASLHNILFLILGWQPIGVAASDKVYVGNPLNPINKKEREAYFGGHIRLFTYRALEELFEHYRFRIEKIIGVGFYPFPKGIGRILSKIAPGHSVTLTMKVKKE